MTTEDARCAPEALSPEASPVCLTIAGSDSGGGAGIQADLKTFQALGAFGASAITCLTAQNPDEVTGIFPVDPGMVALQIRTVCRVFAVAAAKTGMLYSAPVIRAVARAIAECGLRTLVVDPVMVATSGARLLREDAVEALCNDLLPLATLVTPNLPEAEVLVGRGVRGPEAMREAAAEISARFGTACVVKGGHSIEGEEAGDALCEGGRAAWIVSPRVEGVETHGTGCVFSAAATALLARGVGLEAAVRGAKDFVYRALLRPWRLGGRTSLGIRPAAV